MDDGIEIEGMEDVIDMFSDMTVEEADEKKALRQANTILAKEIEKNTPERTGKLKKLSKTVKRDGLGWVGVVRTTAFYDTFQEFGTSKQKKNVGYFSRSIAGKQSEVIATITKELLRKIL